MSTEELIALLQRAQQAPDMHVRSLRAAVVLEGMLEHGESPIDPAIARQICDLLDGLLGSIDRLQLRERRSVQAMRVR